MKVLSLFDVISCGMLALERAKIPIERYVAYEIDKYAIKVSRTNYPQIEQCGDVTNADFTKYKDFDLLIGGSPCTFWSIARSNRETTPDGIGGQLFMQYVRALKESGCKYFLYENNYSIHKNIKAFISKQLGVEPIMINSALVSAQQRKRCYWTNIPDVRQPSDKGILLKDILQSGLDLTGRDKSYCITASYNGAVVFNTLERKQRTMIAEPVILQRSHGFNKGGLKKEKAPTVTANGSYQYNNYCCEPVRIGQYGKGGQGQRIYSINGKSITLSANGGGQGEKTGLYLCPVDTNEKELKIYEVKNGFITVKDKKHPISLPDGLYIIRKLTPIEAERLQTLPDDYTDGISNTQRYKCIGNGWTVDVIAHILKNLKERKKYDA